MKWCDAAKRAFVAELDEIERSAEFMQVAEHARPVLAQLAYSSSWKELNDYAQSQLLRYIDCKNFSPEATYRGLYASIAASFERFVRGILVEIVGHLAANVMSFDEIPENIRKAHALWSGRCLTRVLDPPDDISLDVEEICKNLGTCVSGSSAYALNSVAFTIDMPTLSADGLDKALARVHADALWDLLGSSTELQRALRTKGTRDSGNEIQRYLRDFSRTRNRIVHGAEGQVAVTLDQLSDAIAVFRALASSLPDAVWRKLRFKPSQAATKGHKVE